MLFDRVNDVIKQHKQKMLWETEEETKKRIILSDKEKAYSVV